MSIPIHLGPIEAGFKRASEILQYMKNLIRGKRTEVPITQIIVHHNETLSKINTGYKNILSNLLAAQFTPYRPRKKRFLDLLFGIAGTAFGVANQFEITRINSLIAKNIHRTYMFVDITQLHENHLYKLDTMVKNSAEILNEFVKYSASAASSALKIMISSLQYVLNTIEKGLKQAQNQKLSFSLFPHDILLSIKTKFIKVWLITVLFLFFQK